MTKRELVEALLHGKWKDIPDDEPVFLLRAQDALASETVEKWALMARAMGVNPKKTKSAFDDAEEMLHWHTRRMPD